MFNTDAKAPISDKTMVSIRLTHAVIRGIIMNRYSERKKIPVTGQTWNLGNTPLMMLSAEH